VGGCHRLMTTTPHLKHPSFSSLRTHPTGAGQHPALTMSAAAGGIRSLAGANGATNMTGQSEPSRVNIVSVQFRGSTTRSVQPHYYL
jgi:hypothetical protein